MDETNEEVTEKKVGKEDEVSVNGLKKLVRRSSEKFKGDIKGVDMEEMHEDFYDIDALKKD